MPPGAPPPEERRGRPKDLAKRGRPVAHFQPRYRLPKAPTIPNQTRLRRRRIAAPKHGRQGSGRQRLKNRRGPPLRGATWSRGYFEFFNDERPHQALGHQMPTSSYDVVAQQQA